MKINMERILVALNALCGINRFHCEGTGLHRGRAEQGLIITLHLRFKCTSGHIKERHAALALVSVEESEREK